MVNIKFKALLVEETEEGDFSRKIVDREISDLPEGDVLINVKYSSLNYKDALSATGNKGVTRKYPHTPGIDAAGIVVESANNNFNPEDKVIVTGYDLGMNTSGGYGQYIRVPAGWVVRLPEKLSLKESMMIGTAGFTAALAIYKLVTACVKPESGDILVTGASGGVGSIAVNILAKLSYSVTAATGKSSEKEMFSKLGAKNIIDREELNTSDQKPLIKGRWAGVVDTVGGNILATAIKGANYGGCVACCGNAASPELTTSVYPFILRGVTLYGVDSVLCPMSLRIKLWDMLSDEWKPDNIEQYTEEVSLDDLSEKIDSILQGKLRGRTVVNIS